MKSKILFNLIGLSLVLFSCQKTNSHVPSTGFLSTATKDIVVDSNSIALSTAIQIGRGFLQSRNKHDSIIVQTAETITDRSGAPYMHIINAVNGGFVVLSAISNYHAILAYSDKNHFSTSNPAPGILMFLNRHAMNIGQIRNGQINLPDSEANNFRKTWAGLAHHYGVPRTFAPPALVHPPSNVEIDVLPPPAPTYVIDGYPTVHVEQGPYCTTKWDQGYPFNADCPIDGTSIYKNPATGIGYDLAGCGPLALAQIMYFWQSPASYNTSTYNWGGMNINNGSADASRLITDIGSAPVYPATGGTTWAGYGPTATTTDDTYAPEVLAMFGYPSVSRSETISDQILSGGKNGVSYQNLLFNEVYVNNRPCMITGSSGQNDILGVYVPFEGSGRHSWVCDGIDLWLYEEEITWTDYKSPSQGGGIASTSTETLILSSAYYFSMNWGENGGLGNGFYINPSTNIPSYSATTGYSTSPSDKLNYQYFQTIVYNIFPG